MNDTDRLDEGSVDSEVSFFRDDDCLVYYGVTSSLTCHNCGSGEVWQPMQAMVMPVIKSCLRCGTTVPAAEFDRSVGTNTDRGGGQQMDDKERPTG